MSDLLLGDLEAVIRDHARGATRSQQRAIGPSEVGQSCERRLAMALLGAEKINTSRDDWTSSVGTAIHSWMEHAFQADNERRVAAGKTPRWLIEQTVQIRPGLDGHCDVYDLETHTVLDHKFPGATSIKKYRRQGHPGRQYIWQAHLYGRGWANLGLPVRQVAIAMYPRSGLMRDTWLWREDYDPAIADEALARLDDLLLGMNDAENTGVLGDWFAGLAKDTDHCSWCPFYTGGLVPVRDHAAQCGGPSEDPDYVVPMPTGLKGILG